MKIALVLEDDYMTRRAIAELLLHGGFGVCEGFQSDPIPFVPALDVIVSDVLTRPEIAVVRTWASSIEVRFGVPLVLITGRPEIVSAGAAALGVADIVAKPFDIKDLLQRVRRVIDTGNVVPGGLIWN
jgi:DNA-binding NtrC family response regulator